MATEQRSASDLRPGDVVPSTRVVSSVELRPGDIVVLFDDGSTMTMLPDSTIAVQVPDPDLPAPADDTADDATEERGNS